MTSRQLTSASPRSLKASIRQVEDRLIERRQRVSVALGGVAHSVAGRMVSPGAIFAAGVFGAVLHRFNGLRLFSIV